MGGGEKRADTVFLPLLLSTPRVMHVVGGRVLLQYTTTHKNVPYTDSPPSSPPPGHPGSEIEKREYVLWGGGGGTGQKEGEKCDIWHLNGPTHFVRRQKRKAQVYGIALSQQQVFPPIPPLSLLYPSSSFK